MHYSIRWKVGLLFFFSEECHMLLLSCRMTTVEDGAWEHLAVVYKYLPKAANVDSIKAVGSAGAQLKVSCLDFTRSVFARHALSTCVGYMH